MSVQFYCKINNSWTTAWIKEAKHTVQLLNNGNISVALSAIIILLNFPWLSINIFYSDFYDQSISVTIQFSWLVAKNVYKYKKMHLRLIHYIIDDQCNASFCTTL